MPRRYFPQRTVLALLAAVGASLTCGETQAPPLSVVPQFGGIGDCCWNPDWQGPALYFAPIVYQDVDASWADFITRFTFDNDWNGGNNWDNTFSYPLSAYVYASVVETFAQYFIFYGFFHPRDWCTTAFPPWFWCDIGTQQHENDLEGIMVTVDKRFTTPEWPYGEVVTIETISHTSTYPAYRNCDFTHYSVTPVTAFKRWGVFDGCIVWQEDEEMFSYETPPARPAIFVEARGHGVTMRSPNWSGFPGSDGVIYYPGDPGIAEVPPSTLSPAVRYDLQWLTLSELWWDYPKSLWSKRLTSGGLSTSTYRYLHQSPVGPWDVLYGHKLNCSGEPCGADAPWGQKHDNLSSVHMGDWHNHPAWTWSQHYAPGPTYFDSLNYPYCRAPACRMVSSMYETNYYWDDVAAPQDYVDFSVAAGDTTAERQDDVPASRVIPPELRWEFDTLPVVQAVGTNAFVSQRLADDVDWGYRSRATGVLRLTGSGSIQLTLPSGFDPSHFRYAYVRFRRVEGSGRTVWVGFRGVSKLTAPPERQIKLDVRRSGEWEVAMIPLHDEVAWMTSVRADAIVVFFEGGGPAVLDVDFVIVAP